MAYAATNRRLLLNCFIRLHRPVITLGDDTDEANDTTNYGRGDGGSRRGWLFRTTQYTRIKKIKMELIAR